MLTAGTERLRPAARLGGAALTARPVIGQAWCRCCERAGLARCTVTDTCGELVASTDALVDRRIVLVDHPLASSDNLHLLRTEGCSILLLAPIEASAELRSALRAGVEGLVTVADPLGALDDALAQLGVGGAFASPTGARLLLDGHRTPLRHAMALPEIALTARERDVLRLMVEGLTTKATARRLAITPKTVEAHRSRIFDRLGVRTQQEAVTRAIREPRLLGSR